MKNVLTPLGKSVFLPLGLKAVASAANGSEKTALVISKEEIGHIMEIVKTLEDSSLVEKTAFLKKLKTKQKNNGMLLGSYRALFPGGNKLKRAFNVQCKFELTMSL